MKKKVRILLFLLGMVVFCTAAYAGSIDYLSNQSAEYLMTLNRNAGTDAADIVSYNPAGTVLLPKNGLYLNFSTQYLFKPYEQDFMGKTYKQDEPSIIPNLFAVYKKDAWAGFLSFNVTAGGGKLKWDDGDATTAGLIMQTGLQSAAAVAQLAGPDAAGTGASSVNSQSIEASSQYIGITPGVAYQINDKASVSLAARYIMADRTAKAKADFNVDALKAVPENETRIAVNSDFDYDADGIGGIVGIDIKPINELVCAIRYETPTHLDFKYDMKKRSATVTGPSEALNGALSAGLLQTLAALDKDGQKLRYDLPGILGLGLNYTVMPGLDVMSGFNYFFLKNANMEGPGDYNNGWELGLGSTYKVNPALKVGAGFLYTVSGETDNTPYVTENPHLDAWTIGLGGRYEVNNNFDVVLSGSRTQYLTDSNNEGTAFEVRFKKVVNNIALGGEYRFDM